MNAIRKGNLVISLILFLAVNYSCNKDDGFSLPSVETSQATVYATGGVTLNGIISNLGSEKVVDFGFELNGKKYHGVLPARKGKFSIDIKQDLYPNREYYYTAYVKTETETFRGEDLIFVSNGSATPVLEKCIPNLTHINDTIVLHGSNFPENNTNSTQLRYGTSGAKIISISETEIRFIVPKPSVGSNVLEITAFERTTQKSNILNLYKPIITSITPETAFFGDTIAIHGDHLANNKFLTNVEIGGYNAQVVSTSRELTKVIIPNDVNYSNSKISLFAQNQNVDYNNFKLRVPQFTNVPSPVYTGEYVDIKVDKTSSIKKNLLLNDKALYPSVIDDTTFRFWLNDGILLENRKNDLIWRINDLDVVSDVQLNVVNPFVKIQDGYEGWPFNEIDAVYTIEDEVYVMANRKGIYSDARRFFYKYNDTSKQWREHAFIDTNLNSDIQALGPYPSSLTTTYSPYDKTIYVLHQSQYENNFFKINIDNGNISTLSSNHASAFYGIGFAHGNKVYYTTSGGDDLWQFDISNNTWEKVTNTPYIKGGSRNSKVNVIVVDNYAYFANGATGAVYNDFWRLDLNNLQWEQLADNPNPKEYSGVYQFNDELHFINAEGYKYNLTTGIWQSIDKVGVSIASYEPITAFVQNGVPYLIRQNVFTNITYFHLYIGDLIE